MAKKLVTILPVAWAIKLHEVTVEEENSESTANFEELAMLGSDMSEELEQ